MSQKIKSFLSFVVIFAALVGLYFVGDNFKVPTAKAGSTTIIGWDTQPVLVAGPSHATFLGKVVDMGTETSMECGYDYVYDFGQSEPNVRKSATNIVTSPGIFPVELFDLIPNMHYCVTARCGGGGYSSSQYCFDTPAATSDSQKTSGPVPLTYPPSTVSANSIGGRGRVEGILSFETINYWFTFRSPTFEYKNTEHKTISGSALTGSGNFVTDMMNGLMPSTNYLYRLEIEKGGSTYSGNWENALTGAGQPPVTEFYYCPESSNGCSLTSAAGIYSGTSEADCNAALKAKFGSGTSKICYVPERKSECDGKCSSNFNALMSYCDKYGSACTDTTAFKSISDCNKYVQDYYPGTGRMCYTFENKSQCNITCGASGSTSNGNYYYCPENSNSCSVMPAWYSNINDCNEALKFRFGSNTTRRCFDSSLQSSCNSNCQSINGTSNNNGTSGGSVGPTLYIYYFCPQGKTTCTAMPKGYANKTLCNEVLKVIFKDASRICYEYKDRDACNTACSKMVGKYYNYCMTDTGKCFRTLYPQKDALTCKNYVLGRFGKNTTGWCYENLSDCTNNCKVAGTTPTVKPAAQSGSKLYYCVSGKKRCDATTKFYTSKTACKSYIEQAFPGQTTGKCYVSAEDCAEDCINAIPPAADTNDDVATDGGTLSAFDWRNKDKKNWMTPVKSQGGCGGCWAFAGAGVVEALYNIENKITDISLDLSEQDIISCSGQGNCANGGTEEGALVALKAGVVSEQCFPYSSANWSAGFANQNIAADPEPACAKCSNASKETWKIGQYRKLETGNPEEIKKAIVEKGPLLTAMWAGGSVNENGQIVNYNANFYDPIVSCSPEPKTVNHAVVVVGYNDKEKYWIVRNSWGVNFPTYGAGGYFKLGYDQCNIFQEGAYYVQDVLSP